MQALLVSRPQLMEVVGLVVVDELQLITDEVRPDVGAAPHEAPHRPLAATGPRALRRARQDAVARGLARREAPRRDAPPGGAAQGRPLQGNVQVPRTQL